MGDSVRDHLRPGRRSFLRALGHATTARSVRTANPWPYSRAKRSTRTYAAIEATLNELATELGAALGQERIYVAFDDRTWISDAGEHGG
jgi:hypothetical protein